ncbi:MAG: N-methyl-L-tryptophan oxidase [Polyangia bacterium]
MQRGFDVIVLGLGGMGSAAAYHLARRGLRVLGLERFTPGHPHGSSHGRSRVTRTAYFEDPEYVPLLVRAWELWLDLGREAGQPILTPTGGLMIGPSGCGLVEGSLRSARTHGLRHELLDAASLRRRYPELRPEPDTVALLDEQAGLVDPEASVRAHLAGAQAAGAELRFTEPVTAWSASPRGDRVRVETAAGTYEAGRLVLAPGPWAPSVLAELALPLRLQRQVLYWFDPPGGVTPFLIDRFPVYIWEAAPDRHFYGFPHQPGPPGGVKVAFFYSPASGETERDAARAVRDEPATPEATDRSVHPDEVAAMRRCVAAHIPALDGPLLAAATCLYTVTPDHHFVIALHPRHPNVVVASPCSGHGFKFVPVVGEILADLAVHGTTSHPIGLFRPERFATGRNVAADREKAG